MQNRDSLAACWGTAEDIVVTVYGTHSPDDTGSTKHLFRRSKKGPDFLRFAVEFFPVQKKLVHKKLMCTVRRTTVFRFSAIDTATAQRHALL
jgi:hypothetical protein